jgi:hypothetical protein
LWQVTTARRLLAWVAEYPRRSPVTLGYLLVLAATDVIVHHLLASGTRRRLLLGISTNLHHMERNPLRVLVASPLVIDTGATFVDNLLIIGLGLVVCMAVLERRAGSLRAAGVFVLGHVGATLVAAVVIVAAVRSGSYPGSVQSGLDYGVSYGAIAVAMAVTWYLPLWVRPLWAAFGVFYPLTAATWYGRVPDFSTVGHLAGALLGLAAGYAITAAGRRTATEPDDLDGRVPAGPDGDLSS